MPTALPLPAQTSPDGDPVLRLIRSTCQRHSLLLGNRQVVLFGSRAQGRARARSDYDIAVVGPQPLPLADFFAIEAAFDELPTLHRIDWVDLARAEPTFRNRALSAYQVIYEPPLDH